MKNLKLISQKSNHFCGRMKNTGLSLSGFPFPEANADIKLPGGHMHCFYCFNILELCDCVSLWITEGAMRNDSDYLAEHPFLSCWTVTEVFSTTWYQRLNLPQEAISEECFVRVPVGCTTVVFGGGAVLLLLLLLLLCPRLPDLHTHTP